MNPHASVIVVTEPNAFGHRQDDLFAAFAAQTYPCAEFELIVVDGQSRPATAAAFDAMRARHPDLAATLVPCASTARAAGNNLGAARAAGDLLIFLADDFDPDPELVAAHAAYHALNPDPLAVGIGPGLFPEALRQTLFARWEEDAGDLFGVAMRGALAQWPRRYFYAGNASIRKAGFAAVGGFDERFARDAWDDYEFGLRWAALGGTSQFIAAAAATHRHAVTFEERCAAMVHAGEAAVVLEALHPDHDHGWRAMLDHAAQARHPQPPADAPDHARIAYHNEQLKVAFRRGYLAARAASAAIRS